MKKKVLFALIALFSFLSSWAAYPAVVKVNGEDVGLSSTYVVWNGTSATVPTIMSTDWVPETGLFVFNSTTNKYEAVTAITGPGNYFLKATKDSKTYYVPFQVGTVGVGRDGNKLVGTNTDFPEGTFADFDYVHSQASWNTAKANGGLNAYYTANPDEDVWVFATQNDFDNDVAGEGHYGRGNDKTPEGTWPALAKQSWWGAINATGALYPWIVINTRTDAQGAVRPVFEYSDATQAEPTAVKPWGVKAVKKYGCASIPVKFSREDWKMVLSEGEWEEAEEFDINSLRVILLPDVAAFACAPSVEYNGTATQGPGFSLAGVDNGVEYTSTIKNATTDAEGINGVGTYYYEIQFKDGNDVVRTIKSTPFKVVGKTVNINASRATKVYGQPDPAPEFAIDASSLGAGDEVATDITPFLVFKRATDNEGETCREYSYFIDFTDAYKNGECNYDIKILQAYSLLTITKAPLHVEVTNDNKMWAQNDPSFADYTIVSGLVQNADLGINDTKDNVEFTITRPSAGTADGEKINADLDANGKPQFRENETGYPFAAEAANYDIIFDNAFAITPSSNTDGIKVTFDPAEYVYTGAEQQPIPTVKDGETPLVAGTDYDIDTDFGTAGYKNNLNVSEGGAICQIKLKGNYIATGDASKKQGTFKITKKPLTVYAESYTAEPENGYAVGYSGFVPGENETNAAGFTTPAAPIVSKGASIEQDVYALVIKKDGWAATNYEITPKDGILALNNKDIIYARPDEKTQEYTGTVDKELTFATYTDRQYTNKMESNPVTAVVGQPVYVIAKEDGDKADVGAYDITLRGATVLKDYNVVYDDLTDGYTITYKNLILKGINTSKIYGDADPTFDAVVYDGEKEWTREQMNAVGIINNGPNNTGYYVGCGTWQYGRWNHGEDVKGGSNADGTYPITVGLHSRVYGNYYINGTENGKFDILPFAAKVTADDKTKQFGQADPEFTVTITDNNNAEGHTIGTAVSNAFVRQLAGYWVATRPDAGTEAGEAKGEHAIVVAAPKVDNTDTEVKPNNFTLTFDDGTLTITPAQIAVFAKDQYVDYALDYDKKINPYDVIVVTPTEILEWQKSTEDGLTEDQKAINDKIKDLVKLTVAEGKNKLGGNEDAFVLNILSDDYVLATEDVVLSEDYVYGGATIKNGFKNGWLTIYALETIPLENAELAELVGVDPDEADANPSILQKVLNDHKAEGVTVKVKLPARKMDKDEWYAWVLPFDVKPSDLFKDNKFGYGAAEILDADKSKGNNVVFSLQVAKPIPANTPFIVKVENDMTADKVNALVFDDVKIADMDYVKNNPATVADGVSFVGLYWDYKGPQSNEKYLAKVSGYQHRDFWPGGLKSANVTLTRTNAFLQFGSAEAAANARIFIEDEDGTFTAINGVAAEADAAVAGEGWYTISGVKLNAQPTEKGIYIFNGKKVAIQ
jgi:hypothetical protein